MHLTLYVKRYHEFFWLRDIRKVDINQCCAKCFIGNRDMRVYSQTYHRQGETVDIEVQQSEKALAYYLCGLSAGFNWYQNTHVAFNPAYGENIEIDNPNIHLIITDAHEIRFQQYQPNPCGDFSQRQRRCRNWIFANYIRDGMLETAKPFRNSNDV
mgnify:CR=1 FL=1